MTSATQSKPAPLRDPGRCRRLGEIDRRCIPTFIGESTLDRILDFSDDNLVQETGGFLLGERYTDNQDYVEIVEFLPASAVDSHRASLKFTHETWSQARKSIDAKFPELRIVGWHHTHPGLGIFLSEYDRFIHRNFFPEPWQVAMVVDPRSQDFGLFQWRGDELYNGGFWCFRDSDRTSGAASSG